MHTNPQHSNSELIQGTTLIKGSAQNMLQEKLIADVCKLQYTEFSSHTIVLRGNSYHWQFHKPLTTFVIRVH